MLTKRLHLLFGFGTKIAIINIVLVATAIVWYASMLMVLEGNVRFIGEESWLDPNSQIMIWCFHFAGLIFSALIGAKISQRINRKKFILFWIFFNVASSLTLFGLNYENFAITASLAILYGVSFGLGMPACMSNYSDSVPIENRGRLSGLTMLLSGIGIFAFAAAPLNIIEMGVALSIWRLLSAGLFLAFRSSSIVELKKGVTSFKQVFTQRTFLAYYIPWIIFSLVNFLVPLQPKTSGDSSNDILLIQTAFLGIFAVVGGFLLDSIGRKRVGISGFVMLGLSAAVRGFNVANVYSTYFSAVFEGIAWGLLLVLFLLTLWGDLSDFRSSEKYYALGVIPFFISTLIGNTIGKQISDNIGSEALFPLAAFFLFIAVLPLFYATETLPDKITQKRQLQSYVEKAIEKVNKEDKKSLKDSEENEEENKKSKESTEDEEARKLAEQCY